MVFQGKINFFPKKPKICFCQKFLNGLRKLSTKMDFRFSHGGVAFLGKTMVLGHPPPHPPGAQNHGFSRESEFFRKKIKNLFLWKVFKWFEKTFRKNGFSIFCRGSDFLGENHDFEKKNYKRKKGVLFQNRSFPPESHSHDKKSKIRFCGKFSQTI